MTRKKILIMDEEYWSVEPIIDRIHSVFGQDITMYCADGAEGLECLQDGDYSCIILDIMFPLGSGVGTPEEEDQSIRGGLIILQRIRDFLKLKLPIICFTIRDDNEVKNAVKKYPDTFHISKLDGKAMELLISLLRKYIK